MSRRRVPKVLKSCANSKGYLVHVLCAGEERKTLNLHRVVIEHFGPEQPPDTECSHLDGVRANCHIKNLVWEKHQDNMQRQVQHGTSPVGAKNSRALLTEADIPVVRQRHTNKETLQSIADSYGTTAQAIWRVCKRLSWSHVT